MQEIAPSDKPRLLLPSFQGYQRSWLMRDLLAGVTIGAIAIPGQIAVAKVVGMPPTTGLWACVAAGIFAALFVANRVLWIGSDSTTSPLIFAGLSVVAVPGSEQYVRLAVTLAICVGAIFVVVAIAKMQWIADLLSRPVTIGFMAGVATIIVVGQLAGLLGIPAAGKSTLEKLWNVLSNLDKINWLAALIGVVSLVALPLFTRLNRKLPGALLVMTLATLATALLSLTRYGLEVLGPLQTGAPHWVWPDFSFDAIRVVLPTALAIALIAIAQTAATSRSSADAGGFTTSLRADFTGVGVANLASAGVGAYSVDASPGATVVMQSSGTKSQLGSVIGAVCVLVVVLFAGGLLADLPTATLAAIMILLSVRIVNVKELRRIRSYSKPALALTIVTFGAVVILGVELGVLIAVALALVNRGVKTSRPEIIELGRRPDGHWLPIAESSAEPTGEIVVFRLNGPLWFANASWFHDEIKLHLDQTPDVTGVIIDTTGIDDIDYTGASVMADIVVMLGTRGLQVAMTHIPGQADDSLERIRITQELPERCLFASTEDAYQAMIKPDYSSAIKPRVREDRQAGG